MKNKIDERISKIKQERHDLLTIVSDSIRNNGRIVSTDIKSISELLDYDEKCVKKYEAIVNAQNLIVSLTQEIVMANSEEEIINLRKKLNYYINKVKAELKKRNISEEYINKYCENVSNLRKDIAKYVRYLKRENNISEIDNLYHNYDTLTEEDKTKFKKMLSNEVRYNHRNLNPTPQVKKSRPKKEEKIVEIINEENNNQNDMVEITPQSKVAEPIEENDINEFAAFAPAVKPKEDIDEFDLTGIIPKKKPEEKMTLRVVSSIDEVNEDDVKYLNVKIQSFDRQYRIQIPYSYDEPFLTRVAHMLKNIPLYKANQKGIKTIESDIHKYYGGSDLISYLAYLNKINSIKHGLKSIFNRTYLHSEENRLLNSHEKCAEWLLDYCKKNSLEVNFLTRKVVS